MDGAAPQSLGYQHLYVFVNFVLIFQVSVGTCRMRRLQVGSIEPWAEPVMGSVLLGDSPGVPSPAAAAPALGCFVLPLTMTILY